ncbi:MAG: hypothetical protein Q9211_006853 [Gyalolechia sp. 1 TL-2023]
MPKIPYVTPEQLQHAVAAYLSPDRTDADTERLVGYLYQIARGLATKYARDLSEEVQEEGIQDAVWTCLSKWSAILAKSLPEAQFRPGGCGRGRLGIFEGGDPAIELLEAGVQRLRDPVYLPIDREELRLIAFQDR